MDNDDSFRPERACKKKRMIKEEYKQHVSQYYIVSVQSDDIWAQRNKHLNKAFDGKIDI